VDEFPDTVRIAVHAPSAFHELADELERFDLTRETSGAVRSFARTLDKTVTESGSRFAALPTLTDESAKELSSLLPAPELDSGTNSLATSIKALTSVTQGRGFVARTGPQTDSDAGQKRVVTFADVFRAQPGLVILDATGELEPRVKHGTEVEVQRVPRAVYPHLETMHLTVPKAFDGIAVTRMSRDLVADYARWIVSEIMRANALCEQTLVVVHKNAEARVRTEIARRAHDASVPFVTHWGCDVGSNAYRACGNVFLFGEFHQPRYAYLAKWLGSAGRTAHPAELRAATGQRTTGGVKDVEAAHLLRCFKQMACRGTARDVGPDGIAAPMRLYTTMERPRLLRALLELFPGAPVPTLLEGKQTRRVTKGRKLASYLLDRCRNGNALELSADEITSATGISGKDLKRAFFSRECEVFECLGWTFLEGEGRRQQARLSYHLGPLGRVEAMLCAA